MADSPAIRVDDVSKRFRLYNERAGSLKEKFTKRTTARYDDFWAVDGVSLEVEHGSVYGLVGHNGSGKSTMLKMMAGILAPPRARSPPTAASRPCSSWAPASTPSSAAARTST